MTYLLELKKTLHGKLLLVALVVTFFFLTASLYAINTTIIRDTLFGSYPMHYKTTLLQSIIIGSWVMYTPLEGFLLLTIGVLMGINIALMVKIFSSLSANKGLRVTFGGSSVLAIVSAGCPACGISLLSLFGISFPFLLPIQGAPLQMIAIVLLVASIAYSLRKLQQPMVCEVPDKPSHKK